MSDKVKKYHIAEEIFKRLEKGCLSKVSKNTYKNEGKSNYCEHSKL